MENVIVTPAVGVFIDIEKEELLNRVTRVEEDVRRILAILEKEEEKKSLDGRIKKMLADSQDLADQANRMLHTETILRLVNERVERELKLYTELARRI
jgi:DNA-binding transcriptional regulator GbsR (MarR family)